MDNWDPIGWQLRSNRMAFKIDSDANWLPIQYQSTKNGQFITNGMWIDYQWTIEVQSDANWVIMDPTGISMECQWGARWILLECQWSTNWRLIECQFSVSNSFLAKMLSVKGERGVPPQIRNPFFDLKNRCIWAKNTNLALFEDKLLGKCP